MLGVGLGGLLVVVGDGAVVVVVELVGGRVEDVDVVGDVVVWVAVGAVVAEVDVVLGGAVAPDGAKTTSTK